MCAQAEYSFCALTVRHERVRGTTLINGDVKIEGLLFGFLNDSAQPEFDASIWRPDARNRLRAMQQMFLLRCRFRDVKLTMGGPKIGGARPLKGARLI